MNKDFKKNNTRDFYIMFKQNLSKYCPPSICFKDQNGKTAYSNKDNCGILASYFENLLNGECPKSRFSFNQVNTQQPDSLPSDKEEIIAIIKYIHQCGFRKSRSCTEQILNV